MSDLDNPPAFSRRTGVALSGGIAAALSGAIWGVVLLTVVAVALVLTTGEAGTPRLGAGAVAGAVGALVGAFLAREVVESGRGVRGGGIERWLISAAATGVVLMALSFAHPFGLPVESAYTPRGAAFLAAVGLITLANARTLRDLPSEPLTRYAREVVIVRVLKGLGYIFFFAIVALPFYVMVMTSLKSQQALLNNPLDFSLDLSSDLFRSYRELFSQFNFGRYLLISTIVSLSTVVLTLLFATPGAYAVARLRFRGRALLARSILLIYMVPAIVLVIPLYAVFSQLGLRDSLAGLLIVYPATTIPVALYMLQGYFRGLPFELEEAGLMDGLSRIGVILKITLPLALPALASVALYVFMIAWNEFLFAFMFLDSPSIFTLSRGVQMLNSSEVPRQHMMAGAVLATLPVLVIFLGLERFMTQGLTAGSVKG